MESEVKSKTPLTDAFIRDLEALRVPIEVTMHPRIVEQIRGLMISWAEFARSLEELAALAHRELDNVEKK